MQLVTNQNPWHLGSNSCQLAKGSQISQIQTEVLWHPLSLKKLKHPDSWNQNGTFLINFNEHCSNYQMTMIQSISLRTNLSLVLLFFSCSRSRFIWICHNRGENTPISISWHMTLFALVWFVPTPLLCSELLENNKPGTFSFQAISCCLAGPVCGYINTIQCLEMLCRFLFSWIQYMYIHFFYCFGSQLDVLTVIYLVFVCSWDAGSGCGGRVCVLYQRRAGALQGALSVWGLFSEWTPGAPPPLPGRGRPRASTMLLHSERTAGLPAESAQDCHTVRNTLSYSIQSYSSTPSERNVIHLPL